jgi:4-aminobutyrate aminotransferase/(S)-3-amino-2-methylpropionate transaminase
MSRAWLARLASVDAPWTEARRARRAAQTGQDQSPIVLQSAKGANVFDIDGNRYVDLVAGFGSALLGHAHPRIARTLEMQSERLMIGLGDVFPSDAKIGLTERLARLLPEPGARVILGLSGADAIDAALKTALLATGKPGIVAFEGGYHGLSTGPLAACGLRPEFRQPFAPHLSPHVRFLPYPSARRGDRLEDTLASIEAQASAIGAILVEPVLGRGGVVDPPEGFLASLRAIADRIGALLIVDEMWTGLGRSGALLASVAEGVLADVVCLGKGLGGGLPISAAIGRRKAMLAWQTPHAPLDARTDDAEPEPLHGEAIHTSTHAGHPLACATAIALLDTVVGQKLAERAREEGDRMRARLAEHIGIDSGITAVSGRGLIVGVSLAGGGARGGAIARDLLAKGYLVLTGGAGDVLTLTPPLNIARPLLDGFVEALVETARARPA